MWHVPTLNVTYPYIYIGASKSFVICVSVLEELTVAEFAECLRTLVIFVAVCRSVLQCVAACCSVWKPNLLSVFAHWCIKRALLIRKRVPYFYKRALYLRRRVLYLCKRALYLCKRVLYLCKRAIYLRQRVLHMWVLKTLTAAICCSVCALYIRQRAIDIHKRACHISVLGGSHTLQRTAPHCTTLQLKEPTLQAHCN